MSTTSLFIRSGEPITFQAGQIIFNQGDPGDAMYAVVEGEIEVIIDEQVIDTAEPGGVFGEMALIDGSPRSAMARARTDCTLVLIDETRFMFMVQQRPFFALHVMRIMSERLRRLMQVQASQA